MYINRKLPKIESVRAVEVLDSRGNPTVFAEIALSDGSYGCATAPSGASTGKYEAHEKRDGERERYGGKGVTHAVNAVNYAIAEVLTKTEKRGQRGIDAIICELDGTENKSRIGANAMLPVSMAYARACAAHYSLPLYRYLGGITCEHNKMPTPMMNVLNGGAHSKNNIDIQEFMIVPVGIESYRDQVRACAEIYAELGRSLSSRGYATSVGDEGGYAPMLDRDEEAIELILDAAAAAGYKNSVKLALDAAASEWWDARCCYRLPKRSVEYDTEGLVTYWQELCGKYPVMSLEDGLGEEDADGWRKLTTTLGDELMLVGDDLFVTNKDRVMEGVKGGMANALLIKPNQAGTVTETLDAALAARNGEYALIVSHRSGDTADDFISDMGVAVGAEFIKAGAPCRGERAAKYNRLFRIADGIDPKGCSADGCYL